MSQFAVQHVNHTIRRVTFTNPPFNVVGADTVAELSQVLDDLIRDEQARVVIFDSGTPEYFYNHADLAQFPEFLAQTGPGLTPLFLDVAQRLARAPFVSIAVIRGRTRGGGAELMLAFDLRYASREEAIFGQPEVGTGLVPAGGGGDRLPRLVGRDRALEVLLTSQDYDAERAERYGWITRSVPDTELDAFVDALAERIARFDRQSVLGVKAQVNRATLPPEADLRASWAEFTGAVSWPGFQARGPIFGQLFAEFGVEEVERNLGHYLGVASERS